MTEYNDRRFEELKRHIGHDVDVVGFSGNDSDVANVTIACETCGAIIEDVEPEDRLPPQFKQDE